MRSRKPRQPSGPQLDGLLLVDKSSGMTSHDAVDLLRKTTRLEKVGHTGTLDPMATGLLILCVGKATRLQAFLMKMEKTYEGTIQFGWATETFDAEGAPVGEAVERSVEGVDFEAALPQFRGEILQIPPQYSAKKVQGVRAYENARKGQTTVLEPKAVTVYEFTILEVTGSQARFRVRCSAGTYVRSLANDLGTAIGVPAHLAALRRTAIGNFTVDLAIPAARIREAEPDAILASPHFQEMHEVDLPLDKVMIDHTQELRLRRGQSVVIKPSGEPLDLGQLVSLSNPDQKLIAIAEVAEVIREGGGPVVLQPKVVFGGGKG